MNNQKKLLACAKCYKLHRKCTGESRPCDYCKERKLECVENPDRKKRGRPKGSKNKFKSALENGSISNFEIQNLMEMSRKRCHTNNNNNNINNNNYVSFVGEYNEQQEYNKRPKNENDIPQQYNTQQQYTNTTTTYSQQQYTTNEYYPPIQQYVPKLLQNTFNNTPILNILPIQSEQQIYQETNNNNIQYSNGDFHNNNNFQTYNNNEIRTSFQDNNYAAEDNNNNTYAIPISTSQNRDLIFIPEINTSNAIQTNNKLNCSNCQTEMLTFKFCPHCGTPREKIAEPKKALPGMSRKKILSRAILEIVNENKSTILKEDMESSLKTIWMVVKHPRREYGDINNTSVLGDFSLLSTTIKQVSPNWCTFLGYKQSESERIPLSKLVPSRIDISPKTAQKWDSLFDYTSRNSTVNMSCEFVLCHKFGLMYGVELQITTFANNGLPDTSFIVVKRHWNIMNTSEASQILNDPNIEMSEKIMDEEEEDAEPTFNEPNFELLRKAVDYTNNNIELF